MGELIIGPTLAEIRAADFSGPRGVLATAFYSAATLDAFDVNSSELGVYVRLSRTDLMDWVRGVVDPDALLRFAERHLKRGVNLQLRCSPTAHAKMYLGRRSLLIGSANFTRRGLWGDGQEVLWLESGRMALASASARIEQYARNLQPISVDELRHFVDANKDTVVDIRRAQKIFKPAEEIPRLRASRPPRLGSYNDFVEWLRQERSSAAREMYARAHGKSQLSGHAQNCFFGCRQLFVADPRLQEQMLQKNPDSFRVFADPSVEKRIRAFTKNGLVDEPGFHRSVWRNIAPIELGGYVERRGGLIGSLNRMLPLVALYLSQRRAARP